MYLTRNEVLRLGLKKVGENVLISDKCSIYNRNITIGSNVRIDDFCILSCSEIVIGDYVHISCYSSLIGRGRIELKDFSGVSMRCTILSSNADYSGEFMTNPQIPEKYTNTTFAPVTLEKHALVGVGSIVLPGVTFGEGAVCGSMSFVNCDIPEYGIWAGSPVRFIKYRSRNLIELEKQLRNENS
jgi:acetyltransferase-like isoleucine patch superfamily enzyme